MSGICSQCLSEIEGIKMSFGDDKYYHPWCLQAVKTNQHISELEKWQKKIDTHEKLVSNGDVDAVVFENNKLQLELGKYKMLVERISMYEDGYNAITIRDWQQIKKECGL